MFGSNWYPYIEGDAQREVYVLHGSALQRYVIPMNAFRGDSSFAAALFRLSPAGGIETLAGSGRTIFEELEWIEDGRLMVPVVQAPTVQALWPLLEQIGANAAEVVFENHAALVDAFYESEYSSFLEAPGDYLQASYHTLFGVVLDQLAEMGVVPEFPGEPAPHFGVYIVIGKLF